MVIILLTVNSALTVFVIMLRVPRHILAALRFGLILVVVIVLL